MTLVSIGFLESVKNPLGLLRACALLDRQFGEFLHAHGSDPDAEFLISSALNEQIAAGAARLAVIAARDRWFGMTFQADKPNVAGEIAALVKRGIYQKNLTNWFQGNR